MDVVEVTAEQYGEINNRPYHVFNTASFNSINSTKADRVYYWLFKDSRYRLGLICGERQRKLYSPFSAPFGGFSYLDPDVSILMIDKAVAGLINLCKCKGITSVSLTLPPLFYDEKFVSKMLNALFRADFRIETVDINYAFDARGFSDRYPEQIWRNARKNLKTALSHELSITKCEDLAGKEAAYEIIRDNREAKGYPLRLTWNEVLTTSSIIPVDFFVVSDIDKKEIASAVVYQVKAGEIALVVYWGDRHEHSDKRPMNFLSYKVFEYYHARGIRFVDVGPSSQNSIPNHGLCEFKESIGCSVSPKFVLTREIE